MIDDLEISPALSIFCRLFTSKKPHKRKGERLAAAIERLGPTFIKLGQALSTRSDLIGEEIASDLAGLRDKLPPFPTATARQIIEEEFGKKIAELFTEFADIPVAAASIAQVHKATTMDGKIVAVKILRPEIEQAFARDLELFFWIAEIIEQRIHSLRRLKPVQVVQTFKETVFFELDLRFEAAAASEMADNLKKHDGGLSVPAVHWDLTSRRVLTCAWVDGIAFSDMEAIKNSGFAANDILAKASCSLFSQVFKDGFFHADLHPGNLFLDKNGDLVAVDFGIMGRLDIKSRIYIAEILRGFMTEDYKSVAAMHFDAGYVPATKSREAFTQACMAVARPIMGKPLNEISIAALLGQMFAIAAEFEMEVQPQLLLMQKTMMVAEGVGRMLNPSLNMWELATPLIEDWAKDNFGLKAKMRGAAEHAEEAARKLPHLLSHVENTLKNLGDANGIKLHPKTLEAMQQQRRSDRKSWLVLAWSALVLAFIVAMTTLFYSGKANAAETLPSITVMADSSMSAAVAQIARDYTRTQKATVNTSFAPQKTQQEQITEGAAADILITTKEAWLDELKLQGLVDVYSKTPIAKNRLVLIGGKDSSVTTSYNEIFPIVGIINAGGGEPSFAIGSPETLIEGSYSKEALRNLGASSDLEPYSLYIKQLSEIFDMVANHQAFSLCFYSSTLGRKDIKIISTIPETAHKAIIYYAVVIAGDNMDEARKFLQYLKSKDARKTMNDNGFIID